VFSISSVSVGSPPATSAKGLNMTRLPGRQARTFYPNRTSSLLDTQPRVTVTTPHGIQGASRGCRHTRRPQPAKRTPSLGDADGVREDRRVTPGLRTAPQRGSDHPRYSLGIHSTRTVLPPSVPSPKYFARIGEVPRRRTAPPTRRCRPCNPPRP